MQPDALTPSYYSGPLKLNIGAGVSTEEGRALTHAARAMLGRALLMADVVDLKTTSVWHTFENGVTVRVGRIGGVHLADIVRHPTVTLPSGTNTAYGLAPYGGVIVDGYFSQEETGDDDIPVINLLDRFSPSAESYRRLKLMHARTEETLADLMSLSESEQESDVIRKTIARLRQQLKYLHSDDARLLKVLYLPLRVPDQWKHLYNNPVQPNPLATNPKPPKVYAAQRLIKPTMYSGRMRVVTQVLLGLGRFPEPSREQLAATHVLYDCWCGTTHSAVDLQRASNIQRGVENYPHDSVDETPPDDKLLGSLNYWFHWVKTHGVYKTSNGRYYLIEISSNGVWAMRLPVVHNSGWGMSDEAKQYLNALPLGYPLPSKEARKPVPGVPEEAQDLTPAFDRAVKDKWVKQLLSAEDVAPFYGELQASYAECGWAFSMTGDKIDNVGWRVNAPRPFDYPVFEHWRIELRGGDAGGTEKVDYNHDIDGHSYDSSLADLEATIHRVGQGNAVDIAQYGQCFKVPTIDAETGIPSVVSFDMLPRQYPKSGINYPKDYMEAIKKYPVSDAVVHVFYDGDELVWTRFYNPMNTSKQEHDSWDDREWTPYCMLLGGWTWGDYTTNTTKPKGFYTSRGDPRKVADESRTDMQSQGRKTWESPYMGVEYSWPYPPFHFGYEQSGSEEAWYNDFDPSYRSRPGSPWTAKRHCFHVRVTGTRVTGQSYSYSAAIPLTDREAVFICERHVAATRSKVDYQYAAMVMQFVYYTYPAWIPDYELGIDHHIIPVGNWPEWQLRGDTVKYLQWMFFPEDNNYTKEGRMQPQSLLNIADGTHTAPTDIWDRSKPESSIEDYKITTVCSALGGEYPTEMKALPGASVLWEGTLPHPTDDSLALAHFWCTRSVIGTEGYKQHQYLNGGMVYSGFRNGEFTEFDKISPHRQVTFIGET